MRRLRALAGLPLLAGLLLSGAAATTAATPPVIPGLPGVPGMANLPYVNAGFPCYSPREETGAGTNGSLVTDESFVFLMSSTPAAPTVPGLPTVTLGQDLNFMKCFFHYRNGTVPDAPYVEKNFPCAYPPETLTAPSAGNPPLPFHDFAHSSFIVRDEFAILLCWGTALPPVRTLTTTVSNFNGRDTRQFDLISYGASQCTDQPEDGSTACTTTTADGTVITVNLQDESFFTYTCPGASEQNAFGSGPYTGQCVVTMDADKQVVVVGDAIAPD